jgi:hypothetical protein
MPKFEVSADYSTNFKYLIIYYTELVEIFARIPSGEHEPSTRSIFLMKDYPVIHSQEDILWRRL